MKHSWCSGGRSVVVHLCERSDCIGKVIKKRHQLKKKSSIEGKKVVTNMPFFLDRSEVPIWNTKV